MPSKAVGLAAPRVVQLRDIVEIHGGYARATSVADDVTEMPTFRFTEKSVTLLRLIAASIAEDGRERAWALVGPYGVGKSSFARLALRLLSDAHDGWSDDALHTLRDIDLPLGEFLADDDVRGSFLGAAVLGEPGDLARPLLSALEAQLRAALPRSAVRRDLQRLLRADTLEHDAVIEAVQRTMQAVGRHGGRGVVLVIDEFGRFLDSEQLTAARTLALIQDLAELANRSSEVQLHMFVVLHQNFADYAATLGRSRKSEWGKVQGRFRQFSFQEDPSHAYDAIASALTVSDLPDGAIQRWAEERWGEVEGISLFDDVELWRPLIERVFPLHPLALYALPRLSATLGQNERSLYGFLASQDPFTLPDFVHSTSFSESEPIPSLRLDWLFDFFLQAQLTGGLPAGVRRVIALTESALEQLSDGAGLETQLVKTLGAIASLGASSELLATRSLLCAALAADDSSVDRALKSLVEAKVLLFRDRTGEYILNPGTDLDIEAEVERILDELDPELDLTPVVSRALDLKPIIARRYSFDSGTTRTFQPMVVGVDGLVDLPSEIDWRLRSSLPDGRLLYLLVTDAEELAEAEAAAGRLTDPLTVAVIPASPIRVRDLAREYLAIERLLNDEGVQGDRVAQTELELRRRAVMDLLAERLERLTAPGEATWSAPGMQSFQPMSRREQQRRLSDIFEQVFHKAPPIQNELVNRRKLSSAPVRAVKVLLGMLLDGSDESALGLRGTRPEISIYRTLLRESGWYRPRLKVMLRPDNAGKWRDLWDEFEQFLDSTDQNPRTVAELWDELSAPPFGLRAGVLPILTWAIFVAHRDRVCLFENDSYLTSWAPEHYDRLVRFPERFTIRAVVTHGAVARALDELTRAIPHTHVEDSEVPVDAAPMNDFLAALFGWYRSLSDYARRTRSVSELALNLRGALVGAGDPISFVVRDIPAALGLPPLSTDSDELVVEQLGTSFRVAVEELTEAHPRLLRESIERQAQILEVEPSTDALRARYVELQRVLDGYRLSDNGAVVLLRGANETLPPDEWAESVMSVFGGQAPRYWFDRDVDAFRQSLAMPLHEIVEAAEGRERLARQVGDETVAGWRLVLQTGRGTELEHLSAEPLKLDPSNIGGEVEQLAVAIAALGQDDRMRVIAAALHFSARKLEANDE